MRMETELGTIEISSDAIATIARNCGGVWVLRPCGHGFAQATEGRTSGVAGRGKLEPRRRSQGG